MTISKFALATIRLLNYKLKISTCVFFERIPTGYFAIVAFALLDVAEDATILFFLIGFFHL
jgi:hypothetical protein